MQFCAARNGIVKVIAILLEYTKDSAKMKWTTNHKTNVAPKNQFYHLIYLYEYWFLWYFIHIPTNRENPKINKFPS